MLSLGWWSSRTESQCRQEGCRAEDKSTPSFSGRSISSVPVRMPGVSEGLRQSGEAAEAWKTGNTCSVFKKGKTEELAKYRPVSLIHCLGR